MVPDKNAADYARQRCIAALTDIHNYAADQLVVAVSRKRSQALIDVMTKLILYAKAMYDHDMEEAGEKQMPKPSNEDSLDRLRAMIKPGQQTWDLSPNDVAAITMAVQVLSVIEAADGDHEGSLTAGNVYPDNPFFKRIQIGDVQTFGATTMECFRAAGEKLE